MIYFMAMYVLFYAASLEPVSKRLSTTGLKLLQSSYQSGVYLPLPMFKVRESLEDFSKIHSSSSLPVYIDMLRQLHYSRATMSPSGESKLSVLSQDSPITSSYPIEFYIFISQNWTNLGCEGLLYPHGFHIPVLGKTLKIGVIENMYLYTLNHHDILRQFLCASSPYVTRGDHRNLFITTYAVAFFISSFLDILLHDYFKVSKPLVVLVLFVIVTGIVYISKRVAMFFFSHVIDIQRYYRLQVLDFKTESKQISWTGYILSLVVLTGCMIFCSALLVLACMFSVQNDYSRESVIIHNALQVHLSVAVQEAIAIVLLYVDRFHINISFRSHSIITIGAFFCESLVRDSKQYYHCRRSFCKWIVVDYVVSMKYADEKGWVISKNIEINPLVRVDPDEKAANDFANRLTVVTTRRISDSSSSNSSLTVNLLKC